MSEEPSRPGAWPLWVRAAAAFLGGKTWGQAAQSVGRAERTLRLWREDPMWNAAVREAEEAWGDGLLAEAKRQLAIAVTQGDRKTLRWYLERRDDAFTPPAQRMEHTGEGGGPVQLNMTVKIVRPGDVVEEPEE